MKFSDFLDLLACPETLEPLHYDERTECLLTAEGRSYPLQSGVPILLTEADRKLYEGVLSTEGKAMVDEYAKRAGSESQSPAEPYPPISIPREIIDRVYSRKGENTRILSIGGGPWRNSPSEINLNLALFPQVDVVGNATRLPIRSHSVDGIWCSAVLEHVAGAAQAVEEMVRVVEPGGYVINLVPFMQPLHAYPLDYQRYSAEGLAWLMRGLTIVAKGQAVGPSWTVYEILSQYLDGPGMVCLPRWLRGLTRRTLLPALRKSVVAKNDWTGNPKHEMLSSLVYCIGKKE